MQAHRDRLGFWSGFEANLYYFPITCAARSFFGLGQQLSFDFVKDRD